MNFSNYYSYIRLLYVKKLYIINGKAAENFLLTFPNLVYASIYFAGWNTTGLCGNIWGQLQSLYLNRLLISEIELYTIFQRSKDTLRYCCLYDVALLIGSWDSLFSRIRILRLHAVVTAEGNSWNRKLCNIEMEAEAIEKLRISTSQMGFGV
jgi:hypothetical protein